ncbi:MAG: sugar ABC transporter ATP-binding protein [Christensenellales bacterium]
MENPVILEMDHISKSFPGVKALDDVKLHVHKGSVHAVVGENGAGKSTLMKILSGSYFPDAGTIKIGGEAVKIKNPLHARELGVSIIHQELNIIPYSTVAQSIFLGREPCKRFKSVIDYKKMNREARKLLDEQGLQDIREDTLMKDLTVSKCQVIEITKAIAFDAKVIIMDEPTSAITEKEIDRLFKHIRSLKSKGVAIIYISHKLEEIAKIADEITVIRDGKYIGTYPSHSITNDQIVSLMVGRDITNRYPKQPANFGDVALEVRRLTSGRAFQNISFSVRSGEVLGVSGLMGAGRTEVMRAIFGLDPFDSGEIHLNGKKVAIKNPKAALTNGLAMVTEDRRRYGVITIHSIRENIALPNLNMFEKGPFVDKKKERLSVMEFFKKLSIRAPDIEIRAGQLSGGNQQKVVLAKWLLRKPTVLIMDEPTRGIDVGAKFDIYNIMNDLVKQGIAIVFISSELPELLGMSDNIMIMHEGRMTGYISRQEATPESLMMYATAQKNMFA